MTQSAFKSSILDSFTDEQLLRMKVKDLPLDESAIPFPGALKKLRSQLKRRKILWTPHVWPSEEWFSPDGTPGFAFPFTLLHPRLAGLEKKHVGFLEGASEKHFLKLIRHECGHCIDNAFHLRKNKRRQKLFGKSSLPYPSHYLPSPHSKNYVRHLSHNYAQAHPEEDWAETFAVWLSPKKEWKEKYKSWKAIEKLNLLDEIMLNIQGKGPKTANLSAPLHFRQDQRSLKEYFNWRKTSLGLRRKNFFDNKLNGVFYKKRKTAKAADIFPIYEKEMRQAISKQTRLRQHVVKNMLRELKQECLVKNYQLKFSSEETKREIEKVLLRHSFEYVQKKRHRINM